MAFLHAPHLYKQYGIQLKWKNPYVLAETLPLQQAACAHELRDFVMKAKPEWTAAQRGAVFTKLAKIQIQSLPELITALHAEGDDALNTRLRTAGGKAFSAATIEELKAHFVHVLQNEHAPTKTDPFGPSSATKASWDKTVANGLFSNVSNSESPDWDASAPGGWWRVVCQPSHWSWDTPNYSFGGKNAVHCTGKILAMTEMRSDCVLGDAFWLKLRDEKDQWMCDHTMWASDPGADNRSSVHLEQVCANQPPSLEDRRSHDWSVQAFRRAMEKLPQKMPSPGTGRKKDEHESIFHHLRACYAYTNSRGLSTQLCTCPDLLPAAFLDPELQLTIAKLLRDGYVIIDDVLPAEQIAEFVEQAAAMYEQGESTAADPNQATSGQRDDFITWLDHLSTEMFWPAVSRSIRLLKAVAHALNPALSRYHAQRANEGDLMRRAPLVPPAWRQSVLTASARAMLATYPGGGSAYIPHRDNYILKEHGERRANGRELTAIMYANPPDWDLERDGGALRLYLQSQGLENCPKPEETTCRIVAPVGGRLVIFFSELWHEVMPCERVRRALSLWILRPTDEVPYDINLTPKFG